MTPQDVVNKALDYRDGNAVFARWDLTAALTHPNCANCAARFGTNDLAMLRRALWLLG